MQNIDELVDLHECPLCEGGSILEEEGNKVLIRWLQGIMLQTKRKRMALHI